MNAEEMVDFINRHPLFFLASSDGSRARVRAIMMHKTDAGGIIFTTGKNKPLYSQLTQNPLAEACFYHENRQLRVSGIAVELDGQALKEEIVAARPFMKPWIEMAGYEVMAVFRLEQCTAVLWTEERPLKPGKPVRLFDQV